MLYTLKDYQTDAVGEVLANLKRAMRAWRGDGELSAFSLTATTGAGKTVMAAAVIEALFTGSPDFSFDADPGAVVLWFTDDPSLNDQTRQRIMAASDRVGSDRLRVIENTFSEERLEAGRVYFLNSQKLSKNALLVREAMPAEDSPQYGLPTIPPPPDDRARTMWDILRNTIGDPDLTLVLILDEAHRGMKPDRDRATTVQRLINGTDGAPAVPIVLGISATVERFNAAMAKQERRTVRPAVVVDPARVQDSGLLKDDIRLDFPTESGRFDTTLLTRATRKLREATARWTAYAQRSGNSEDAVLPLMVVQMPNTPSEDVLREAVDTIRHAWEDLPDDAFANVFGEHQDLQIAGVNVAYIEPQRVQDRTHVRVLFAKDAISTGWDCPRAEVLVSFRPAKDETYITQLLGRMVRTPLARRIPGDDLLNSVSCLLPAFSRATAVNVAQTMTGNRTRDGDGSGGGDGRRVLLAPIDMKPNATTPESVWDAFDKLPSQTLPRKAARAVDRYTALAFGLTNDGLRPGAYDEAWSELCRVLDAFCTRHPDRLAERETDVRQMNGASLSVRLHAREVKDFGSFAEAADRRAIDADFRTAANVLTRELAKRYVTHLHAGKDDEDDYIDEHIRVAALGKMESTARALDDEAGTLALAWFNDYRVAIKGLAEERRLAYDEIKGMAVAPQRIDILRPRIRTEDTQDEDGHPLPTRPHHLMSDEAGNFPVGNLNDWEMRVLDAEMSRPDALAWYRNPSRASADSLAVAWQDTAGNWRRMCPDFVFFHGTADDVKTSIVDPHGIHLADALPKLRGLAAYAERHGGAFHRIEAVAEVDGELRVLDLKEPATREAIAHAQDVAALYRSGVSARYR